MNYVTYCTLSSVTAKVAWEGVENVSHETGKRFFITEAKTWYKLPYNLESF